MRYLPGGIQEVTTRCGKHWPYMTNNPSEFNYLFWEDTEGYIGFYWHVTLHSSLSSRREELKLMSDNDPMTLHCTLSQDLGHIGWCRVSSINRGPVGSNRAGLGVTTVVQHFAFRVQVSKACILRPQSIYVRIPAAGGMKSTQLKPKHTSRV